jgi:serine/threonine-protein kinase
MPFIEGQSLRQRLKKAPPPSLQESVRILGDIARALEFAHDHGVVHRDIKPENVMLSGGTAVVTDFGIAKAVNAAQTQPQSPTLTGRGNSIGTPGYMAPEQAAGDKVDGRADIYAWGVVAYEAIAGKHPFSEKRTAQQLIAAQIAETPRPIDEVRRNIPAALSSLITRAMAKEPLERPQSARELLETLDDPAAMGAKSNRRMIVLAVIAAILLIGAIAFCQKASAISNFDPARPAEVSSLAPRPA